VFFSPANRDEKQREKYSSGRYSFMLSRRLYMISVMNAGNWAEQYSTIGERAFLSITMTIVGIIIVVVVLVVLSFVVSLMSRLINGKKVEPAPVIQAAEPEPTEADMQVTADETAAEPADDGALIAAISAAVSCMLADSDQPSAGFKIRRIRRV
jgi:sodium pump decarboxylase gamma subunit